MKKLFLLCAGLLLASGAFAQDYSELLAPMRAYEEQARQAVELKNYASAERSFKEMIRYFNELPDTVRTNLDAWNSGGYLAGTYYNLACYQSLQKKRRAAVDNLAMSVRLGFIERSYGNYAHMMRDTDLDNIRTSKGYEAIVLRAREQGDFLGMIQRSVPYDRTERTDSLPVFRYASADDPDLQRVRQYFNLDSIAGTGDELSRIKNLLRWVHDNVRHDGSSYNPTSCTTSARPKTVA